MRWVLRAAEQGFERVRIPALASDGDRLHLWCEARRSKSGDWGDIDIIHASSQDGVTWTADWDAPVEAPDVAPNAVAVAPPDFALPGWQVSAVAVSPGRQIHNPTPFVSESGAVRLLHCVNYREVVFDGQVVTPDFEDVLPGWQVCAVGPGQGLTLPGGRMVAPVWLSPGTEGTERHHPSLALTIFSDDDGRTWWCGEVTARDADPSEGSLTLHGGRVLLSLRSEDHHRWLLWSRDGIRNWTKPRPNPWLPEVVCQGSVLSLGERLVATGLARTAPRADLVARYSDDGGITWPHAEFVHVGAARYSVLAVHRGDIWCAFEAGSQSKGGIAVRKLGAA